MKYFIILLLTAFTLTACNKEADAECMDGTIENAGDPAADGLGWVLRTNAEVPRYYVLSNLPASYQENGLAVNACLVNTGQKMNCMCAVPPDKYKVVSIQKR
jgi:hypothetical protein